jgi:acetate kinase
MKCSGVLLGEANVTLSNEADRSCILTVNGGSSSLKFALFDVANERDQPLRRFSWGRIERIGLAGAQASVTRAGADQQKTPETWPVDAPDLGAAADVLIGWLDEHIGAERIAGVGHRLVHGGPRYDRPQPITAELIAGLNQIAPFDPDHLPGELLVIERFAHRLPAVMQVACFDTAFHRQMPRVAQIVALPQRFEALGLRRYGFHGLSYTYLIEELGRIAGPEAAKGRVVLAHLGAGASMAAVYQGRCVETTMGFTPASGLVMATRSGDLDPSVPWFLARAAGVTAEQFHHIVNHESGLLGVSATSPDLRDLYTRQDRDHDQRATEAIELFTYQAKKGIGALAAVLGGLDTLVFAGGIGENSAAARVAICAGLEFLGISLDGKRNAANEPVISTDEARAAVRVIRTDEELVIARAVAGLLGGEK